MPRYKLVIAYEGTDFFGWQRQPEPARTVQREVERAASQILARPVTVRGSSRTDTGVHALGQVAQIDEDVPDSLPPDRLKRAINAKLPDDVLIRSVEFAPDGFDVHRATRKRYRYLIWADPDRPPPFYRRYVYHYYQPVDAARMDDACARFVGEHDFASFRGKLDDRENTVRRIFSCTARRRGPLLVFAVEGSGFLYHMVRTMTGTALEAGRGRLPPAAIPDILAAKDRTAAGPCLPALGLHLQWIHF